MAALPAEGDTERMRAYNWQDVEDLQEVCWVGLDSSRSLKNRVEPFLFSSQRGMR